MKRIKLEVCPQKGNKEFPWKLTEDGQVMFLGQTQREAIRAARLTTDALMMNGLTISLKIKRRDGTIREERTYPRSSDPRRTKG